MPLYEFKCKNPESPYNKNPLTKFISYREFVKIRDTLVCEVTGDKLTPIISKGINSIYKVRGFYKTDYKG